MRKLTSSQMLWAELFGLVGIPDLDEEKVLAIINTLPERQRQIVRLRFGFGKQKLTMKSAGTKITRFDGKQGVSRETARHILKSALDNLKKVKYRSAWTRARRETYMDQKWFEEFDRLQNQLLEHLACGPERMLSALLQGSSFEQLVQGFRKTPGQPSGKVPIEACYRTLGLSPDASWEDVQHRYRQLSKRLHPDVAGPETAHLFAIVTAAYEQIRRGKG